MSSSSDIEKLFDHFGGDASAYQEIGRENEAHTARTRWPLLVTLDLRQPPIPAIGPHGQTSTRPQPADGEPAAAAPAADRQDAAPKDAVSVMRAKAPLFTRSPRRDIPPVIVPAAAPVVPRGAARFGAAGSSGTAATLPASGSADAVPPVDAAGLASAPAEAKAGASAHVRAHAGPASPATMKAVTLAAAPAVAPTHSPMSAPAPGSVPASAATSASAPMSAPASPPQQQPSILGKLFNREPEPAPSRAAGPAAEPVALQSLFDRLRGTPHGTAAPARAAEAAAPNSWLVNGPRRS